MKRRDAALVLAVAAGVSSSLSAQVLYQETFNDSGAGSRWTTRSDSDSGTQDFLVNLAFDYTSLGIPAAPSGSGSIGALLDANTTNQGLGSEAEGVNAYPNGQNFSGDYIYRLDLYGQVPGTTGTTEDAIYGLNTTGNLTNWYSFGSVAGTDGLFYSNTNDGGTGAANDYIGYVGFAGGDPTALALFDNLDPLPQSVFPANPSDPNDLGGSPRNRWARVEVSSIGNRIALRYNGVVFDSYTNPSAFNSGNVFIGHQDLFNSVNASVFSVFDNVRVLRASRWTADFDGGWDTGSNWATGVAPSGVNAVAYLGPDISGPRGIVFGGAKTLGDLTFDSPNFYNVSGAGPLTMDSSFSRVQIEVLDGSGHQLNVPVNFADAGTIYIPGSGSDLTIGGNVSFPGVALDKSGAGRLRVRNLRGGTLNVTGGTLEIAISGAVGAGGANGASKVDALSLTGATTRLDIGDNLLIVDAGPAGTYDAAKAAILSGRNGGTWDGPGIVSSLLPGSAATRGIGFARASDLGGAGTLLGQSFGASAVLVRYTVLGDANLSGTVEIGDFSLLAANFNSAGDWGRGDFNYDGSVDIGDFSLLAAGFNTSLPGGLPRDASVVPEPATGLLAIAAAGLVVRRRRR